MQRLQPKILAFTFGASLLPVIALTGLAWQFVHQPLIDLEKTRLDDQVRAFTGYTAATTKGLRDINTNYTYWTDFFNAVVNKDRNWLKKEVTDSLVVITDGDAAKVINRQGDTLAESGSVWRFPTVKQNLTALVKTGKPANALIDTEERQLVLLAIGPIYNTDGTGNPPGTLVTAQTLNNTWLRKFLDYSQLGTKVEIISLQGKSIISNYDKVNTDAWEKTHFTATVLPAIQQGRFVYRIEPDTGFNTVYAPITSRGLPVAVCKLQIVSKYFNRASFALNRLTWIGLGLATMLSIAIAHLLTKQIAEPINQLAERSKTLATGDLNSPIPGIDSGGELGQLAKAYQEMAQELKALIDNLEQRVNERTQELNLVSQTLEERVNQRTEELSQKNQQLLQAQAQTQQLNFELTTKAEQLGEALRNLQRAQAQLVQTEKMSSLGQLVAGIAHEFNNPINFIYGNLTYVNRYTQDILELVKLYQQHHPDPQIQKHIYAIELDFIAEDLPQVLSSIKMGAERIRQIVKSLQTFSRFDEAGMKPVNIHEGIDSTLLILQHRFQMNDGYPDIRVIKQYGNLPLVECYPSLLNQVFMNILSNAIDALSSQKQQSNKQILIQTEMTASKQIRISIRDNGSGIPANIQSKVFDPFFTTKPVGKGIGLGLSISYQILKQHQGSIEIISEPEQGTEVAIALPQAIEKQIL